jgi:hypothetical protein
LRTAFDPLLAKKTPIWSLWTSKSEFRNSNDGVLDSNAGVLDCLVEVMDFNAGVKNSNAGVMKL